MTFVPFCGYYVFVASLQQRLPENVPGDFFVDSACIDCDTCSQLAPTIFRDHGEQCSVYHQPETGDETQLAMMALVSCPTGSMEKLLSYEFEWVLPGHGDIHKDDARIMHDHLARCVSWMKTLG